MIGKIHIPGNGVLPGGTNLPAVTTFEGNKLFAESIWRLAGEAH